MNLVSEESVFSQLFPFVHTVVWHALKIHWNSWGVSSASALAAGSNRRSDCCSVHTHWLTEKTVTFQSKYLAGSRSLELFFRAVKLQKMRASIFTDKKITLQIFPKEKLKIWNTTWRIFRFFSLGGVLHFFTPIFYLRDSFPSWNSSPIFQVGMCVVSIVKVIILLNFRLNLNWKIPCLNGELECNVISQNSLAQFKPY